MRKGQVDRVFARVLAAGWVITLNGAPRLPASWAGRMSHVDSPHDRAFYLVGDSLAAVAEQATRIAAHYPVAQPPPDAVS